jgi:hypothetical protein
VLLNNIQFSLLGRCVCVSAWCLSLINSTYMRQIHTLSNAERVSHMPRLVRVNITQKSIQLKDDAKALAQITHNKMQRSVCEIFIALLL